MSKDVRQEVWDVEVVNLTRFRVVYEFPTTKEEAARNFIDGIYEDITDEELIDSYIVTKVY